MARPFVTKRCALSVLRTLSCCPLMTELLLSLFTCTPYGGAACAGVPKAAMAAAVAAATGVGGGTAEWSPPWLTIVPRVSLLGGRATAAAAPLWSSSIVVVVVAGGPVHRRWVS